MPNTKDKMFLLSVVVVSVLAGMMLMLAIDNYKNQEEVGAAEARLFPIKAQK
ncbi:MAG: hypothetical protein HYZ51_01925 [Candidatus Doudnabacteria bacterium]|nr:hypothetical protein [Candidatus Doudnabacteria bacterium]